MHYSDEQLKDYRRNVLRKVRSREYRRQRRCGELEGHLQY